jgi:hypothetical protein
MHYIEASIANNEQYILEEDQQQWKKELNAATSKFSKITNRYIKRATKKSIDDIIQTKIELLPKELNVQEINQRVEDLYNKIDVRNVDEIFESILEEYGFSLECIALEKFWNQEIAIIKNKDVLVFLSQNEVCKKQIKLAHKENSDIEESQSTLKKYIIDKTKVFEESQDKKDKIASFLEENNLSKFNIEFPKEENLTEVRTQFFIYIVDFINSIEIKEKRKVKLFELCASEDYNKLITNIINNYVFHDVSSTIKSVVDQKMTIKFNQTCSYAGIYHTLKLNHDLDIDLSTIEDYSLHVFYAIKNHILTFQEKTSELKDKFNQIMSTVEGRLTKNLYNSNPFNQDGWFKRGLQNAIFYEHGLLGFNSEYNSIIDEWNENLIDKERAKDLLEKVPDLKDLYYKARKKKRDVIFYAGETNSGKTYSAFNDLVTHKKGVYLSPLRLLALEGQEEIIKRGFPCSYLTGEESDIQDGANFICSTIEMLDIQEEYDCAIIDEIQMIANIDRGTGWLEALIGVNASTVILTGTKAALPIVQKICDYTNDNLTVVTLEKKTRLVIDNRDIHVTTVPDNSAIIAFSKKEIHRIKGLIDQPTAIIYGSLSPEVRRQEAEKFRSGEAKVLISTDAIGMGLNLPIEHIYFSGIEKYNGVDFSKIKEEEVLQISGRAGRYKLFDEGKVGFIDTDNDFVDRRSAMSYLKQVIDKKISRDVEYARLSITRNMFYILSDLLDNYDLKRISRFFFKFMQEKVDQDFITVTIPTDFYDRLDLVDELVTSFEEGMNEDVVSFEDKLNLLFLPLDVSKKSYEAKSVIKAFLNRKYLEKDKKVNLMPKLSISLLPNSLLGIEQLEKNVHLCDLLHNLDLKYPDYSLSVLNYASQKDLYQDAMIKIINHEDFSANCRKCEAPIEIGMHSICESCFKKSRH